MIERLPASLFFDLDGTILDSLPGVIHSVRAAFNACGLPLRHDQLRRLIGPPIRNILALAGEVTSTDALNALEKAFRASYDSEGWQMTACFPNAKSILITMHSIGHRMFIVTNKPRHIALRILESESILHLFADVATLDSRKPGFGGKAEMMAYLLGKHDVGEEECLMIGDTIEDARAAMEIGIKFAYMTHGYGQPIETGSLPITLKFDNFAQFLPYLELQGGLS